MPVAVEEEQTKCVVHRLPCVIERTGEANVSKYFKPEDSTASFRGRRLVSSTISIPDNYSLCLLEKNGDSWSVNRSAAPTELVQWHHDHIDPLVKQAFDTSISYAELMQVFMK